MSSESNSKNVPVDIYEETLRKQATWNARLQRCAEGVNIPMLLAALSTILLLGALVYDCKTSAACESRGGVLVRGKCIKAELLSR